MKVSLESLCTLLTDGTHYTPPNIGEGFPFLTVVDMQPSGLNFETCSRISPAEFAEADRQNSAPKSGDVLFSKDGTVGKVHVVNGEGPFAVLSSIAIIRPDSDKLDPGYLAHFLRSPEAVSAADRSKTGSALRRIILKDIKRLSLNPPPLPEQRRIAGILDQADALRRLRRQSLSRLSALGQAIFYEMFGDLVTNPNGWPEKSFRDLAKRITVGIVVKPASYYRETGVPAIRGTNIKPEGIDLSDAVYFSVNDNEKILSKTRVWTDDLVIVRSGRPGLAALVPPEMSGINSIDVLILTPDKDVVVPRFVKDLINSPMGKRLILSESRGQVQQHFNVGSLSKAKLFLPPYKLQLEYLSRISAFDKAAVRRNESEEMLDSLFTSLQHRAFRGEL